MLQQDEGISQSILARITQNRWGKSQDFQGPAFFPVSDAASYMNASIIKSDGGWMSRR